MTKIKITSIEQLLDVARSQSWRVTRTGSDHWRAVPPDRSKKIVHSPSTPSDWRSLKNTVADFVRSGLNLRRNIVPTASPKVRAEKCRLAELVLRHGKELGLPLSELSNLLGESLSSLERWQGGGMPRTSEDTLREYVETLAALKKEREKPTPKPVVQAPVPVPAPVVPPIRPESREVKSTIEVGVKIETSYVLDLMSLSVEKLTDIAAQCLAELSRRALVGAGADGRAAATRQ